MLYSDDVESLLGPASPLDRALNVSIFDNVSALIIRQTSTSLRALVPMLRDTRAGAKKDLGLLKLATFGDKRSEAGSLRHNDNLVSVDGVEGDYDAGLMSVDEACERLALARLAAAVYTTPSHSPSAPHWRVVCPTSRPMSPDEREGLCARLNGALEGVLAPESFRPSQAFYFGAVGDGEHHRVELVEGRAIDVATELPSIGRSGREPSPAIDDDESWGRPDADVSRITSALAAIPADARDDRHTWLDVGMALHHAFEGDAAGLELWSGWSAVSPKFDEREQARSWKSFRDRSGSSITVATLYHLAQGFGWNASPAAPAATRGDLTFLSPSECEAAPSRGYVMKGFIAPGDVGCVFGAPGGGKSLLAPLLGYMVAQGRRAFDMRTRAGPVFYVAAEDAHGMRGRVKALKIAHGDAPAFTLVDGVSDLFTADSPDFAKLMAAVEKRRPALIVVDTIAAAFPGLEENDAKSMNTVVTVARRLAAFGAAVLLVHHDTKAAASKGSVATPRGHSVLFGALDMALHLEPPDGGVIRGRMKKNRNGSCAVDVAFRIAVQDFGRDEDGDPITRPFAEELSAAANAPDLRGVTPKGRKAYALLCEAGGAMLLDSWLTKLAEPGVLCEPAVLPRNLRQAATRARDDLISQNLIRVSGNRVELIPARDLDSAFDDVLDAGFDDLKPPSAAIN